MSDSVRHSPIVFSTDKDSGSKSDGDRDAGEGWGPGLIVAAVVAPGLAVTALLAWALVSALRRRRQGDDDDSGESEASNKAVFLIEI